ncbi:MAG: hypothetical protein ACD_62C00072G0002 [uncultured bacterium]|nr:MAG: hypothetical protein ACD_62C00072G0002 [uncultured bacterium]
MANYPRNLLVFEGSVFHVTWQCHNKDWLLNSEFAKALYYDLLLKYKTIYDVIFFSYCLMDNHVHLTGRCSSQKLFSDFFRVVNGCFSKILNKHVGRRGQVIMDRFKSPTMETDDDLMNVIIYNDLNPRRTVNMVHPKKHKWSSYHHYAFGKEDPLLTEPEFYKNLGKTLQERQIKYRTMIDEIIENDHRAPACPYKKDDSYVCFIGNPLWVQERYERLMTNIRVQRKEWQDRHRQMLESRAYYE